MIKFTDVYKIYPMGGHGGPRPGRVSFEIDEGEFVAIVGQSGSGKSTAMNIIGCLDVPTSGTYELAGVDVSTMDDDQQAVIRNKMLGFIFQQYKPDPHPQRAGERGAAPALRRHVVLGAPGKGMKALDMVGLSSKYKNRPNQLSGGQQQRVTIDRALAGNRGSSWPTSPPAPWTPGTGREVLSFLQQLNAAGHTIVLITHDNSIAIRAQRIIRLQDGRIIYDGDAHDPRAVVQPTESGGRSPRASEREGEA